MLEKNKKVIIEVALLIVIVIILTVIVLIILNNFRMKRGIQKYTCYSQVNNDYVVVKYNRNEVVSIIFTSEDKNAYYSAYDDLYKDVDGINVSTRSLLDISVDVKNYPDQLSYFFDGDNITTNKKELKKIIESKYEYICE